MNNHHKLMGLLIVFLMVMSVAPMTNTSDETQISEVVSYVQSETYEWQTFNRDMNVTTFVSPDGSRDALWHFLNSAEESIYVEIYGINHPHIIDLIHELHDTKPSLEMKFLLGWNSLGYYSVNDYVANNLTELGYEVKWTSNPDFIFAHQKFLIIDNKTTIIHSGNWAKTSFPEFEFKANREWSIAMTDVDVTSYYRNVFDGDWLNGTAYNATLHGTGSPLTQPTTTSTYQSPFATAGEFSGPMNVTPILSPDTSLQGILYLINLAQYTLDIQIPYFTSVGDAGEVDEIIDAILTAKDRGVTVRVISDEEKDFLEIAEILTDHGIPIVWQDTRWSTANHNKGIIVDGRVVLVSSINYSDGSISSNREAGVIIESYDVAQWFLEVYDFDWGMGNCDDMEGVNLYWEPNIPDSTDTINVTVYTHMLYSSGVDDVIISVNIAEGGWTNYTITDNVFLSSENTLENYFYEIAPQTDGTNISIQAFVNITNNWNTSLVMDIHVVDSIPVDCPVDGTSPTLDSPDDIVYVFGTTGNSIAWTAFDKNPGDYEVFRNESYYDSGLWGALPISIDIDGIAIGVHTFNLTVADTSGNIAYDVVEVEVLDSTILVVNSPADIEYELGNTGHNITWIVSGPDQNNFTVFLDAVEYLNGDLNGSDIVVDVDGLSIGLHIFEIIALDDYDNFVEDSVNVTVFDTTNPSVSSPDDIEYDFGTTGHNITWIVSDESPVNYTIFKDDMYPIMGDLVGHEIVFDIDGLAIGVYTFDLIAADSSHNLGEDTVEVTVLDTTVLCISSPDDIEYELGSVDNNITWIVLDGNPVNYTLLLDNIIFIQDAVSGSELIFHIDGLSVGEYTYHLIVYDESENFASDSIVVTVLDTTNPTILEVGDFDYIVNTTGHTITWTASDLDPDYYIVTLDGVEFETDDWDGSAITIDIDGMAIGEYTFNLTVFDKSGNSYSSAVVVTVVEGLTTEDLMIIGIVFLGIIIVGIIGACFKKK